MHKHLNYFHNITFGSLIKEEVRIAERDWENPKSLINDGWNEQVGARKRPKLRWRMQSFLATNL